MLTRRTLIQGASALATLPLHMRGARAQSSDLVLMTWGGLWSDSLAKAVDAKFEAAYKTKVVHDRGAAPAQRIPKAKLNASDQKYDLLQFNDDLVPLATAQGAIENLSPISDFANAKNVYPSMIKGNWIAQLFSAVGICYNTKEVKNPPTSWADLWRPEFRKRILVPASNHSTGMYILPIGALASGKDPKDVETGFDILKRMADLEPIFAADTDTMRNAFTSGEAVIGMLYKSQTFTVRDRGVPVSWVYPKEGAIPWIVGTSVAKGSKNKAMAEKYIDFTTDPLAQAGIAKAMNYSPSNRNTLSVLDPELRSRVEFTDREIEQFVNLDVDFMSQNQPKWLDRWNRIVMTR